ncbi:MAG: TspO/MBR family protein [Pseudomonadota bacterium]|nr:TspO/MBR family protein [Pseudomonadota bacterium]
MDWVVLTIFFGACVAAASTGSLFPTGSWYRELDKPRWTPPDWIFPIAWTFFYTSLAVSAARVAMVDENHYAIALWSFHIALNTLWTPVVFGAHNLFIGMIVMILLWLSTLGVIITFYFLDTFSGLLLSPYLLWVSFAASLNYSLWLRNPDKEKN